MTVYCKESLLFLHAFSQLHLLHAAFVDSYEIHAKNNRLPVNRFLFVTKNDHELGSIFRDIANNKLFPMRENNLYFIPCNHLIDLDIEADLNFVSFQFNFELFYCFDIFESYPRCEIFELPELIAELPSLLMQETELAVLFRVNEIINALCARLPPYNLDIREKLSSSTKYREILDFVRNSGNATITVEQLAEMSHMRRDVFSRNFTRDMGITPKNFISTSLIHKASKMLMAPEAMVKEVAEKLHFSSEYYFSNFFKKHIGMSPKEFQHHNGIR